MARSSSFRTFSTGLLAGFLAFSIAGCDSDSSSDSGSGTAPPPKVGVNPPPKSPTPPPAGDVENAKSIDDTCIVWKHRSEKDGNLVVLTPSGTPSGKASVSNGSGKEIRGRYIGRTNGNRATYRFDRPGSAFSDPAYLKINSTIYRVKNPGRRHSC